MLKREVADNASGVRTSMGAEHLPDCIAGALERAVIEEIEAKTFCRRLFEGRNSRFMVNKILVCPSGTLDRVNSIFD